MFILSLDALDAFIFYSVPYRDGKLLLHINYVKKQDDSRDFRPNDELQVNRLK